MHLATLFLPQSFQFKIHTNMQKLITAKRNNAVLAASQRAFASSPQPNPFDKGVKQAINHNGKAHHFYKLPALGDDRIKQLPYSIRVLLESAVRNCDDFAVKETDVEKILDWVKTS